MKTLSQFTFLLILSTCFLFQTVSANWQKSENKTNTQNTLNPQGTQHSNSDSLPSGVTKDWLNDLRDENGNKISNSENSRAPGQIPEDPEGDALQRKIFNGLSAGSNFGISVSSAGDVNGDGFDDVIIGAYLFNSNTGRAYIYYGGVNLNTNADVILTGETTSNVFGCAVSSAGDVNGDGFSDVIVGAYGNSSNKGRAYIFFGGSTMNNTADVIMSGEFSGNDFGTSVSTAGDVNGDGYSDVVIGADLFNSNTGKAYIYYGGSSMNNSADVTLTGSSAFNTLGKSVSTAGDVNGDGFSDVIIGANGYSSNTGRAYILYGGISMDNIADVVMTGEAASNNFGVSVSMAGDVNGDGYSDVICGAYGFNSSTGKAYIYYGGANMNSTADVTMTGEATFNFFGNSVSGAGDVNGDGFSDVIIGAFGNSSSTGKAYVYFGGTSMDATADFSMAGETANSTFGLSVASTGDVNGDGYPEVLVGAYGYGSNTGRAYFYDYFMKNEITSELTMTGEANNNLFGNSISSAGDVNGDGYSDIIVGATGYNSSTGKAYIYFGGLSLDTLADVTLNGEASLNSFGKVSSAGDVNGDGYDDVIVGASQYNSSTGRAYIFYGGSAMNNTADVIMTGEAANNNFGISVSAAGDVNGDGYSDVIIGASGFNSSTGKAYIYFGSSSMDNISDATMIGESFSNSLFGSSVASAGDVNGDGYPDVIIGAYAYNSSMGRAYVYFGGTAINDNTADITLSGEATSNYFGNSVSTAGDINGDGFSDMIIGAYSKNTAYIYYGGSVIGSSADVILYGEAGSLFGKSVSSAGDINKDGYSDVIVGSEQYGSTGRAYIYYGGISMNSTADCFMTGETSQDRFGSDVSFAGDINGDGYSDVIVGAYDYGTLKGKSYLYTGSAISAKPILISAKDVPNDQGGKLNLKWARSANDVQGNSLITDYLVQRSFPPSGGNFSWQNVTTIPASHESFYTYLDNTPSDSNSNNSSTFFYRITARTNDINQSWRSNILSGRSLDNISPPMVSPFNAFTESANVRLTWKRNTAPDLFNYVLYRSVSNSIDPYTETPLNTLTDSTYLDTSPLTGLYYYFVVAQDIHNNLSPVAIAQAPVTPKSLFLFGAIQGLYDPSTNTMIYDTVTVYLRNAVSPFAKIDSSKKEMYGPGTGQNFTFLNAQNNIPYYVEVKHRNALETWSADPVTFISDNASIAFSVDAIYAYGNNEIQVDASPYNVFAFYSGDVNQDGTIDASDLSDTDNDSFTGLSGYVRTDVTGDNFVDAADVSIVDNNAFNAVSVVRP